MIQDPQALPVLRKRANLFVIARLVAFVSLSLLAFAAGRILPQQGRNIWGDNPFLLLWFGLGLLWKWASQLATRLCRYYGLSLDGTTIEKIKRTDNFSTSTAVTPEPFVLNRGCSASIMLVCSSGLFALFFFALFPPSAHHAPDLIVILIFSAAAATVIFSWRNLHKPQLRADERGILICDIGVLSRFIRWPNIDSCDIVQQHNVFGEVVNKYLVLRDARHRKITTITLADGSIAERRNTIDRLINFISLSLTGQPYYSDVPAEPAPPSPPPRPRKAESTLSEIVIFSDEVVEMKIDLSLRIFLPAFMGMMSAALLNWREPTNSAWGNFMWTSIPLLFLFSSLGLALLLNLNAVRMRADRNGFWHRVGFFDVKRYVSWPDVAAVEAVVKESKNVISNYMLLKDRHGKILASVNITNLNRAQSDRLLAFMKAKLT